MHYRFLFLFLLLSGYGQSQTLGGNAVFNFLNQPNTAQLSALGGVNITAIGKDVGMSFHNPSLLRESMNGQADLSFNSFLAGITAYGFTSAFRWDAANTNIGFGVNYLNYGEMTQTDASGAVGGSFRPRDYVVQAMASKQYKDHWWYGATLKFIYSGYGQYRSSGIAADVGITYYDEEKQVQASVVVKNLGTQLKTYDGSNRKEELPFDLQAGVTARLKNAPLQFSLTAHHLHRFNIHYNDTAFRASEGDPNYKESTTLQKVFSHLVLGAQLFLHEKIEVDAGYNFLRRQDLNAYNMTSGLNGFNLGIGVLLKKARFRYATGFYQQQLFHQLSLNISWKGEGL